MCRHVNTSPVSQVFLQDTHSLLRLNKSYLFDVIFSRFYLHMFGIEVIHIKKNILQFVYIVLDTVPLHKAVVRPQLI